MWVGVQVCILIAVKEGIRSQGAGDTGGFKLLNSGAESQTGCLCENKKFSELLTHLFTSHLPFIKELL